MYYTYGATAHLVAHTEGVNIETLCAMLYLLDWKHNLETYTYATGLSWSAHTCWEHNNYEAVKLITTTYKGFKHENHQLRWKRKTNLPDIDPEVKKHVQHVANVAKEKRHTLDHIIKATYPMIGVTRFDEKIVDLTQLAREYNQQRRYNLAII